MEVSSHWFIKTAFLQSKPIEREVYVIPLHETTEKDNVIWKLKMCVYGLGDASRNWYRSIKEKLGELKVKCCKLDPALFVYHENSKLQGIICTHINDFIYGGNKLFNEPIIRRNIKKKFTIGTENEIKFVYLGLNIQQYQNYSISVDQISYINNIDCVEMDAKRKAGKNDMLTDIETKKYRMLIDS